MDILWILVILRNAAHQADSVLLVPGLLNPGISINEEYVDVVP